MRKASSRKASSRKAFTLLELLIVMAIIALLAAILYPVFGRVRQGALRASCAGNLKQFGLAMKMYCQDYDGRYPFPAVVTPTGVDYWYLLLTPYTREDRLYLCNSGVLPQGVGNAQGASHYGVNSKVVSFTGFLESGVQHPTATYLVMDAGSFFMAPEYFKNLPASMANPHYLPGETDANGIDLPMIDRAYERDYRHGRHLGGVNVAFCDGHVKWHSPLDLIDEAKLGNSGAWNPAN